MNIIDIITKKKNKQRLSADEISFFVKGLKSGKIEDYKASSLLMSISLNGMDIEETYNLTMAMLESGTQIDLSAIQGTFVDKHSTGGVSDSTTLVIAPIVSALGVKFAKMSGRALGHTGGTVDKLECFPGYNVEISTDRFQEIVNNVGCSIVGQSKELVPADKKLYELRDLTGNINSIPLIASSIMSKKLATGVNNIVLDVKYGSGAFMKNPSQALKLAKVMVEIGKRAGKNVNAVVSRMSEPLGNNVGCNLEVQEVVEILKGKDCDLAKLSFFIAARLLEISGVCNSKQEAYDKINEVVANGSAYEKFIEFIKAHNGSVAPLENGFETAPCEDSITFEEKVTISKIDAERLGRLVCELGGGRTSKGQQIDHSVGVKLFASVGEEIEPGTVVATIYAKDAEMLEKAKQTMINDIIQINQPIEYQPLIWAYVTQNDVVYDTVIAEKVKREKAVMEYDVELKMEGEEYQYKAIANKIEHTLLVPAVTEEMIKNLCTEAEKYSFCSVCVHPMQVSMASKMMPEKVVKVCTVVGFPFGESEIAVKVQETKKAVACGADEIDMVMCISKAKAGDWKYIKKEISSVVKSAKKRPVKVIIETSLLTDEEIKNAVFAIVEGKAQFVKTSTGMFGKGATMDKVKLIKSELVKLQATDIGIKASGGIKTVEEVKALLNSGATRIGTSNGIQIADTLRKNVEYAKEAIIKESENI